MSDFRGRASLPCATCGLVDGADSRHIHGTPVAPPLTGKIVTVDWQKRALEAERKLAEISALHVSDRSPSSFCTGDDLKWPCDTRRIIDGAVNE